MREPLPTNSSSSSSSSMDKVCVFCRVKPPLSTGSVEATNQCCLSVSEDRRSILMTPPDGSAARQRGLLSSVRCTFTRVLDQHCSQDEVFESVALPLTEDLIAGRNGLLFAYGVTGSGKTYTMRGKKESDGLLPRVLDRLFASLEPAQLSLCVESDGMNGFTLNVEAKDEGGAAGAQHVAVFISLIEIYNNQVVDLLEELPSDRAPNLKMLREDARRRMFVAGGTEVACRTVAEALHVFKKGERRRKVAHTVLNAESSRSHTALTIRLVRASVIAACTAESSVTVSQLVLVDLAGSERTNRTQNVGQRLREASCINNSLLTLRKCIEQLRENQAGSCAGPPRIVPYRESKMTHLFRNYFDGDGRVSMIVCVNTNAEEYDETIRVLQFAVMTQEIQVPRTLAPAFAPQQAVSTPEPPANTATDVLRRIFGHGCTPSASMVDTTIDFCFPPFPSLDLQDCHDEEAILNVMRHIEERIVRREVYWQSHKESLLLLRNQLLASNAEVENHRAYLAASKSRGHKQQQQYRGTEDGTRARMTNKMLMPKIKVDDIPFDRDHIANFLLTNVQETAQKLSYVDRKRRALTQIDNVENSKRDLSVCAFAQDNPASLKRLKEDTFCDVLPPHYNRI